MWHKERVALSSLTVAPPVHSHGTEKGAIFFVQSLGVTTEKLEVGGGLSLSPFDVRLLARRTRRSARYFDILK